MSDYFSDYPEPLAWCLEAPCRRVFACPAVAKCPHCGSNQVRRVPDHLRADVERGLADAREIARGERMVGVRVS